MFPMFVRCKKIGTIEPMPRYSKLATVLLVCSALLTAGSVHAEKPLVEVHVRGPASPVDFGDTIPIVVDIVNNLDRSITHAAYSLTPTSDNDEAQGVTVQAVYRDQMEKGSIPIESVPTVASRHAIPLHTIEPGERLQVYLDASKWQIADGWKPGEYKLSVRVTHLGAGPGITLSVTSNLCEFVIRHMTT
jgi:hypothetical protein